MVVCFPVVVFGIVGSLAFGVGIPFVILADAAIHRCTESQTLRNGTPHELIFMLAALEIMTATAVLVLAGWWGAVAFIPGIATAAVGRGVKHSSTPIVPPPPVATTRQRASGWRR